MKKVRAIVYRPEGPVTLPDGPVVVTQDFNPLWPIGRATLSMDGADVVADIELLVETEAKWPAVGLMNNEVRTVSIGFVRNVDPSIPAID